MMNAEYQGLGAKGWGLVLPTSPKSQAFSPPLSIHRSLFIVQRFFSQELEGFPFRKPMLW
jgi:hypothetical protein